MVATVVRRSATGGGDGCECIFGAAGRTARLEALKRPIAANRARPVVCATLALSRHLCGDEKKSVWLCVFLNGVNLVV